MKVKSVRKLRKQLHNIKHGLAYWSGRIPSSEKRGLHYSVGSYVKLSGIHGGGCWFDMNISIGTHQIFINLVSV